MPFPKGNSAILTAVVDHLTVGLLALLLGTSNQLGADEQHRLDGGPAHHVDQVVDRDFGMFDQVAHGQEELLVLDKKLGQLLGVERVGTVGEVHDLIGLGHRWWHRCKELETPDATASSSASAATDLFNLPLRTGHHPNRRTTLTDP